MKKLILIIFTLIITHGIYSQGNNLQFNRVVNEYYTTTGNGQSWHQAGTITVGANKVLKITSYAGYWDSYSHYYISAKIGNHMCLADGSSNHAADTPIWLGSGTYTVELSGYATTNRDLHFSISGIEFDIVP